MKQPPVMRYETHYGQRLIRCYAERPQSVDAMFREVSARDASRIALVDEDRRISYAELEAMVAAQAAGLVARGCQPGERIGLLLNNCAEFVSLFLAAARIGMISVPMSTRQALPEIRYVLQQSRTSVLIADAACAANIPPRAEVESLRAIFTLGATETPPPEAEPFDALACAPGPDLECPAPREEDTLCLLYTSGTTGNPKGAMITHLSAVHSVLNFEWALGLQPGDVAFLSVPASHVTGLVAIILPALRVGGTTVILRDFKARKFLERAAAERINYSLMVPAMYNLCLLDKEFERFDLSSWRVAGFGGAPMPGATIEALARALPGLVLQNVYGSTETTSPATVLPPGAITAHSDTVGIPLPVADIVVVDDAGIEVPRGTTGELLIGGPMVVPGYWENPQGNANGFVSGYWRSGDLGSMDAEGFVRVVDRRKDMINRGGFKIYSIEVENALAAHPAVVEAAVIGQPDPVLGERVQAFLWLGDGQTDAEAIRAHCAARLSDYKVPEKIVFLTGPLPRNANGKVQKTELRRLTTV
ncbi:class I adenylate-forming enzyme family protein [Falsigemmobacter faecalis]|uniref:3-methylmercaptopropionyl-CoA ligase n=1 Tax=Falsigemmobacter faecalis TaxID=2488730 RepID=A0A3P3DVJ8_9RHOB|nr:class I adenylate-forming enzyme family protein [Falsigemmobacter faecalis]RRH78195.1 long-chain fatty acid--CoA ligase [Falsigemmobacter faecalis]